MKLSERFKGQCQVCNFRENRVMCGKCESDVWHRKGATQWTPDLILSAMIGMEKRVEKLEYECSYELKTFVSEVLHDNALLSDIDDWVENWHNNVKTSEIHEYLGMSIEECKIWMTNPDYIEQIIEDARERLS